MLNYQFLNDDLLELHKMQLENYSEKKGLETKAY